MSRQVGQSSQVHKNPALLSTAFNRLKYRDLPALPGANDHRSRANSFDHNDDLSYFSSKIIQHQCPIPPPPPPKSSAPPTNFSQILGAQFNRINSEHSSHSATESPHPVSLVPGRTNTTDITSVVHLPTGKRYKPNLVNLVERKRQITSPTVPTSLSSRTYTRRETLVQKTHNVSKSLTHPRTPRDGSFHDLVNEIQIIPTPRPLKPVENSISNKPLPFVPPSELCRKFEDKREDKREDKKDSHSTTETCNLNEIDSEKLEDTAIDQNKYNTDQSSKRISSESRSDNEFLAPITECAAKYNSIILSGPKLPVLSRISVFGTDIFYKINVQEKPDIPQDTRMIGPVSPDFKLKSNIKSANQPKKENSIDFDITANNTTARPIDYDIFSSNKSQSKHKGSAAFSLHDISLNKIRLLNTTKRVSKNKHLHIHPKMLSESTSVYTSVQDNQLEFHLQKPPMHKTNINPKNTDQINNPNPASKSTIAYEHVIDSGIVLNEESNQLNPSSPTSAPKNQFPNPHYLDHSSGDHCDFKPDELYTPSQELDGSYGEIPRRLNIPDKQTQKTSARNLSIDSDSSSANPQDFQKLDTSMAALSSKDDSNTEISMAVQNFNQKEHEISRLEIQLIPNKTSISTLARADSNSSMLSIKDGATLDDSDLSKLKTVDQKMKNNIIKHTENISWPILDATKLDFPDKKNNMAHNDTMKSQNHRFTVGNMDQNKDLGSSENLRDQESPYLPSEYDNYWASTADHQHSIATSITLPEHHIKFNSEGDKSAWSENERSFVVPLSVQQKNNRTSESSRPSYQTQFSQQLDDLQYCIDDLLPSPKIPDHGIPIHTTDYLPTLEASCSEIEVQSSELSVSDKTSAKYVNDKDNGLLVQPLKLDTLENIDFSLDNIGSNRDTQDKSMVSQKSKTGHPYSLPSQENSLSSISSPLSSTGLQTNLSEQLFKTHKDSKSSPLTSSCLSTTAPSLYPANFEELPSFKGILDLKSPQERIQAFNNTRERFATIDTGLGVWIRQMKKSFPQYESVTANFDVSEKMTMCSSGLSADGIKRTSISTSYAQLPYIEHLPDILESPTSPKVRFTAGSNTSGYQHLPPTTATKLTTLQVQTKGKELFHTAGVLGGKAGKAGKGLLVKGKNKLRSTGGGDKID